MNTDKILTVVLLYVLILALIFLHFVIYLMITNPCELVK